jgi:hypothetical protein
MQILSLHIATWQSEPHQQHQNPAERQYQNIKRLCNTILDCSGAPAYTWLLCLMYVCFLLNHTWCEAVDDIPIRMSTGSTNDISPLLCFYFWEPIYYKLDDSDFLPDSREKRGHFVGISESKQFTGWKSNNQNNHCSVGIGGRSESNRHVG